MPLFGQYNEGVPNFLEHIKFMDSIGFITFDIVDKFVPVLDSNGPTSLGVMFHAIVFCIILVLCNKANLFNKL